MDEQALERARRRIAEARTEGVSGERLDGKSPPLEASSANGSYAEDMGSAMIMGMNLPTAGCWEISGQYEDAELRFVVWVAP